ncbi:MAG UNVERIFIED_CONTAM: hypothetical protein LVR18_42615 [Planctomycetaceae bacterium]
MKKFWAIFFWFWPLVALWLCAVAPANKWWFPSPPLSTLGHQIDGLFYLILIIVAVTFVGTQFALGYAMWKGDKGKWRQGLVFSWQPQVGDHLDHRSSIHPRIHFVDAA